MIEHAQLQARRFAHVQLRHGLPGLQQAQEMEGAVQHADVVVAGDDRGRVPVHHHAADHIALVSQRPGVQMQACNQWRAGRRARDDRAIIGHRFRQRWRMAEQAVEATQQLLSRYLLRRRACTRHQLRGLLAIGIGLCGSEWVVAQPQVVAVLGASHAGAHQGDQQQ